MDKVAEYGIASHWVIKKKENKQCKMLWNKNYNFPFNYRIKTRN